MVRHNEVKTSQWWSIKSEQTKLFNTVAQAFAEKEEPNVNVNVKTFKEFRDINAENSYEIIEVNGQRYCPQGGEAGRCWLYLSFNGHFRNRTELTQWLFSKSELFTIVHLEIQSK